MSTKKKPCIVTITETRHRKQPFLVTIDKPGKAEPYQLKQRYSRKDAAKRGALRNLGAKRRWPTEIIKVKGHFRVKRLPMVWSVGWYDVQFVFNKKK